MRILYVLTSLGIGGAERQTLAHARRMAGRGHQVRLIVLRRLPEEWPAPLPPAALTIDRLDLSKSAAAAVRGLLRARQCLRSFRPGVVHSHGFHANIFARLLRCIAPMPVIVSTVHNVYEGGWRRMLAYRLTNRLSTRTTTVSEAAARRFVLLRAISPRRCLVLPNAIELAEFAPDLRRRVSTRATMGAPGHFVWLAAGRIVPAKDYRTLLRAFARVQGSLPQTRLWIAGEDRANHLPALQSLARELRIDGAVRWLGLRRDLTALLDAADAFVLGSAWEGMPLALAEAMAMAKPVVATDVGGVRELVGGAGVVVPPGNPQALAAAMRQLAAETPSVREALGRAARARIEQGFNLEVRAGEWEQLYQSLIAQRS